MSEDAALVALRERLYHLLPQDLQGEEGTRLYALWSGMVAPLVQGQTVVSALREQGYIESATDIWLTLHAKGLGIYRVDGETDEQLRIRIRNIQNRVTPNAILQFVNDLLATVTEEQAVMLERPQSFTWDDSSIDEWPIWWLWNAFALGLPLLPVVSNGWVLEEGVLEEAALDAGVVRNASYAMIETAVNQCRAAGIRVFYLYKEANV